MIFNLPKLALFQLRLISRRNRYRTSVFFWWIFVSHLDQSSVQTKAPAPPMGIDAVGVPRELRTLDQTRYRQDDSQFCLGSKSSDSIGVSGKNGGIHPSFTIFHREKHGTCTMTFGEFPLDFDVDRLPHLPWETAFQLSDSWVVPSVKSILHPRYYRSYITWQSPMIDGYPKRVPKSHFPRNFRGLLVYLFGFGYKYGFRMALLPSWQGGFLCLRRVLVRVHTRGCCKAGCLILTPQRMVLMGNKLSDVFFRWDLRWTND